MNCYYLTPFCTFFEMGKKYRHCRQSTYCIWFCSDSFHCWVLPGMGLFHQQFFKTIFAFGNMWQLRIWILDLDVFRAKNELSLNMHFSAWMHGEKFRSAQRQLETFFIHVAASQFLVPSQSLLPKKNIARKKSWENCLHVLSSPKSGNSSTSKVARPPVLTDKASVVGPCVGSSVHVPNGYLKVAFNWLLT